ncbi:MAG: xerD [Lachnospiraceae bacterium]|jgi:integrase/recombinase XerD|nr:xerD [Lachnospiraceae bacterium]
MEQHIDAFITYLLEVKHASKNTIQAYSNDLKKLQNFLQKLNITTITRISETSLTSFVLSLEKEGLSPASVSRNIASVKAFLLYLLKQGKITGDPSERMKAPKVIKKSPQIIDETLMDKLLKQPDKKTKKGIRDKAMLELMYATGMKVSELTQMRMSDINLSGRYITCGEKKERNIPLGRTAKEAIQNYLEFRQNEFPSDVGDTLFLNSNGEPLSRQGFWKILRGYAKEIGIDNMNPNIIRNSFAAHLIENGADLSSVSEFLGHSDIAATQAYLPQNHKSTREVYMKTHPRA